MDDYPGEPSFNGNGDDHDHEHDRSQRPDYLQRDRPQSSSTVASSRRQSNYDGQRVNRRSRPPSGASQVTQGTSKSRGKQPVYSQPSEVAFLSENATSLPVQDEGGRLRLIDDELEGDRQPQLHPVPNFSQPYAMRRRPSGSNTRDWDTDDVEALPPVPKTERFSAATTQGQNAASRPQTQQAEQEHMSGSSEERPYSSRRPRDFMPEPNPVPRWLTEIYTISYLIFFSIFGVLARLGVQWITFYPGAPVTTPVIWANVGGSLFMGFLAEDQRLFGDKSRHEALNDEKGDGIADVAAMDKAELMKRKKTIPLYIGLATGFCGSFTSFSSFARDFFLAMSNNLPSPVNHPYPAAAGVVVPTSNVGRNGGYSFEALLAVIFSTLALSLGALIVGAHIAMAMESITPALPVGFVRRILDPFMVFLGWGCWLGAIFFSIFPPSGYESWRGEVLFALVFAPAGCLLRFYASLKLNGLVATFPLGTFAVNMLGTAVEGMCYDIQHVGVGFNGLNGGGIIGCQILQGIMDGFCGALTTISTWVAEINGLQRKHGYLYTFTTLLGGLGLMVIIMGSVQWSHGFSSPVCSTGYPSKVHT